MTSDPQFWRQESSENNEYRRDSIPSMRFTFPSSATSSSNLQRATFEQAVPIRVASSLTQHRSSSTSRNDGRQQHQQQQQPQWSQPETDTRFRPSQQGSLWPPQQQQQRIPIPALPVIPLSFRHQTPQSTGQFNQFQPNNHNNRFQPTTPDHLLHSTNQQQQQQQQQINDELPTGWMTQQLPPRRYTATSCCMTHH